MKKEILQAAKECFEANKDLTKLHVTSDLMCFAKAGDAKSHSNSLKDETVEVVERDSKANAGGDSDADKEIKKNLVAEYETLTGNKNGNFMSIEKLQEAIVAGKAGA